MLKLSDFPAFVPNIEGISIGNVTRWLNKPYNDIVIQNKVSNHIIYPQNLAQTPEELEIDLAILRERLKVKPEQYYNSLNNRIIIPDTMLEHYPNLVKLSWAFIDAFRPLGIVTLLLTAEKLAYKNLGTFLRPQLQAETGMIVLVIRGKRIRVKIGDLVIIPTKGDKVDIEFESASAKLLGNYHLITEIASGPLGIILDTRKN